MTRTPLTMGPFASRLAALGFLGLAGCAPIESGESTGEPVVGRLKFNDRVIDLTPAAFADGPNAVPRDAVGHIIADIDLREAKPVTGDDDGQSRSRSLKR
jgi:hypothetical protein